MSHMPAESANRKIYLHSETFRCCHQLCRRTSDPEELGNDDKRTTTRAIVRTYPQLRRFVTRQLNITGILLIEATITH